MAIREPAVAGMFYPSDKKELSNLIRTYVRLEDKIGANEKNISLDKNSSEKSSLDESHLNNSGISRRSGRSGRSSEKIHGIIVPHAGYEFSGSTAGKAYALIKAEDYDKVIILCPNHTVFLDRVAIDSNNSWRTPLGDVPLDMLSIKKLIKDAQKDVDKESVFVINGIPHLREHAAEVQVPFLQEILGNFTLTPMVVGLIDEKQIQLVADSIVNLLDDKTLLIISTDLSHFLCEEEARKIDESTIKNIAALNFFSEIDACGEYSLRILMKICKKKNWKPRLIEYTNSGIVSGTNSRVVGYASFWF